MVTHLFAYGTLQPELAPEAVRPAVNRLQWVGRGTTAGMLFDLGSYPGATFEVGPAVIHGAVFRLPPGGEAGIMSTFDEYEGVPDLYRRVPVQVTLDAGFQLTCWAYQYNQPLTGRRQIPSGVYAPEHRP